MSLVGGVVGFNINSELVVVHPGVGYCHFDFVDGDCGAEFFSGGRVFDKLCIVVVVRISVFHDRVEDVLFLLGEFFDRVSLWGGCVVLW